MLTTDYDETTLNGDILSSSLIMKNMMYSSVKS